MGVSDVGDGFESTPLFYVSHERSSIAVDHFVSCVSAARTQTLTVRLQFGSGLSYTTFEYTHLAVSPAQSDMSAALGWEYKQVHCRTSAAAAPTAGQFDLRSSARLSCRSYAARASPQLLLHVLSRVNSCRVTRPNSILALRRPPMPTRFGTWPSLSGTLARWPHRC